MKYKTDLSDYPVLPKTINDFASKIIKTVKSYGCITYSFSPHVGGARTWIKFMLDRPEETNFKTLFTETKIVCFEPVECLESSNLGFFYLLLEKLALSGKVKNYEEYSLRRVITDITDVLTRSKKKTVIFLVKLDSFPNLNPIIGNLLYTLWKDNKDNLTFITTLSKGYSSEELNTMLGTFSECLFSNFNKIESVGNDDILKSIDHWSTKLGCKFNPSEVKILLKYSNGYPMVSKILCQEISKLENRLYIDRACKDVVAKLLTQDVGHKLKLNDGDLIYLNNSNISQQFSYQEFSVLKLLLENVSKVVNRDDIADILWQGKAYEKYSDWAIDKFVSLIRNKLKELRFSGEIKSKKGDGFILIQ